jgi:hypothetical protein
MWHWPTKLETWCGYFVFFEAYFGNNIKRKINNQLSEENTINHGVRRRRSLSAKLFNINAVRVK